MQDGKLGMHFTCICLRKKLVGNHPHVSFVSNHPTYKIIYEFGIVMKSLTISQTSSSKTINIMLEINA
jgi:hypothetical protein